MSARTFSVVRPHTFDPISWAVGTLAIPAEANAEQVLTLGHTCLSAANGVVELMQSRDGDPINGNETFALRLLLGVAMACYSAIGVEP